MTGSGSAQPPTAGAGPHLNWTAVSALAAAIAAVVALVAYLAPPTPPPQPRPDTVVGTEATRSSPPDPVGTRHAPATPNPSSEPGTSRPVSPAQDFPPLSAARPGGCGAAAAALTAYRRNAGTVRSSQAAAAQQTYRDLMGAGLDAQGAVQAKISRLASEFQELNFRLTGMTGGDPNQVIVDINTDVAELTRLCGSS
jgi:hypothetical protein